MDFQDRDNLSVKFFIDEILPRHAQHIESVWFRMSREENNVYNEYGSEDDEDKQREEEEGEAPGNAGDASVESSGFTKADDATAGSVFDMGRTTWDERVRIDLFYKIVVALPNLNTIDMDVLSGPVQSE